MKLAGCCKAYTTKLFQWTLSRRSCWKNNTTNIDITIWFSRTGRSEIHYGTRCPLKKAKISSKIWSRINTKWKIWALGAEIIKPPNRKSSNPKWVASTNHHKAAYKLMMTICKEGVYISVWQQPACQGIDILTIVGLSWMPARKSTNQSSNRIGELSV